MDGLDECIKRAQNGDKDAYGELYKQYYSRIYRYCRINLYNRPVADDVCQEVFIRAWKALPKFSLKDGGTFQAFLFRIARNLIIDLSRKKKEVSLEQVEEISKEENLIEGISKREDIERVRNALSKLADIDRQIIILRYFEDMSHSDIAKIIKIREGALRVRTIRLLKKLRELL
ncbi:MAG TPA: RNA polymerase sigma factor [Candidatus Acidoferrales bacterium]|nr:RNA polymerase sigma factor [Candidatus Acidoferrales bacterium]